MRRFLRNRNNLVDHLLGTRGASNQKENERQFHARAFYWKQQERESGGLKFETRNSKRF
jgi:hypothetical protein